MSDSVSSIILLVGLAVGVDYTMFYLKREREERAAGRSEQAALEAAAATSGRSVLDLRARRCWLRWRACSSPATPPSRPSASPTMTVVAVAMLGSLTVLPALLSKLGDKVDRGRVPFVHRLRRHDGEGRIWGAIIGRVLRRPLVSAVLAGGLLVALAVPALQLQTAQPSIDTYPQKLLTTYNRIKESFPGRRQRNGRRRQGGERQTQRPYTSAIGQLKRRALATGSCTSRSTSTQRREDGREHLDPDRRRRDRLRARTPPSRRSATRSSRRPSERAGDRGRRHRHDRRHPRLQRSR